MIKITVLVNNLTMAGRLLAEHGLAFWIEIDGHRILFDTGQGFVIQHNAAELNLPLQSVQKVILSHGHYDHTGGLGIVLKAAKPAVYAHPAALNPKFARNSDGTSRDIGMPAAVRSQLESHEVVDTTRATKISDRLHVTGTIPRATDFEDVGGAFYLDAELREADLMLDDQAAYFDTPDGLVVLLGCAHAGLINTLRYVQQLAGGRPIHTVIGGFHLLNASDERMCKTIEELRRLNVNRLLPIHCTGFQAAIALWNAFPNRCEPCYTGTTLRFR